MAVLDVFAAGQQKINLRSMQIKVEADLNPKGLMGQSTDDRVGFQQVRVEAHIDADLNDQEKQVFLDQVCERCPLHDNIKWATEVVHQYVD